MGLEKGPSSLLKTKIEFICFKWQWVAEAFGKGSTGDKHF
jgi:hypothetical protein